MSRDSQRNEQVERVEARQRHRPREQTDSDVIDYVDDGVYYASHDMARDGLCTTIAMALSEVSDVEATSLISNFSRYADPDALNRLFRTRHGEDLLPGGVVQLRIQGHLVRIETDGRIAIDPNPDHTPRL